MKFAALVTLVSSILALPACPRPSNHKSGHEGEKMSVTFVNDCAGEILEYWLNFDGEEVPVGMLTENESEVHNTFSGHVFRFKTTNGMLVEEVLVAKDDTVIRIKPCGDVGAYVKKPVNFNARALEFEGLVDRNVYACDGVSKEWSCVRRLSPDDISKRDPEKYGFARDETTSMRKEHETIDDSYTAHIPLIPKLSSGFLKMKFTKRMLQIIDFYHNNKDKEMRRHEPIGGDYTNMHKHVMDKVDLDRFQTQRAVIISEMNDVLQWWTQRTLRHTSTFGIRIYRRDTMLINHVDRADTHLASAVLQIAQDVDEGWPLEVILDDGTTLEVYLQPGEMVLYEGARLFHGRPMRFEGDEFANVFTHFAPETWVAVGRPWDDPLEDEELIPNHTKFAHTEL